MSGFTQVTVSGRYLDPATGNARSGTVTFTLGQALHNGDQTSATSFTATLDSSGRFTVQLPATNDLATTPAGQVYRVVESLDSGTAGSTYALPVLTTDAPKGILLGTPLAAGEPSTRPSVTGAKGGNAALGSLLTALANLGIVTDSTTA